MAQLTRRDLLCTTGVAAGAVVGGLTPGSATAGAAEKTERIPTQKRDWWDKEFRKLVTLGESTTAGGWSSCRERCWASLLARQISEVQRVPVQLHNVGIGGNVISTRSPSYPHSGKPAASERLDKHVIAHQPDLLVISYGLNDARGGTALDLFTSEMHALIRQVRKKVKPLIVLLGPYYMTGFELFGPNWNKATLKIFHRFNQAVAGVAAEADCLYVDLLATYQNADWLVHHDGVHANDLGHRLVANKIFEVLAANCSALAKATRELEKQIPRWRDESVLQRDYK